MNAEFVPLQKHRGLKQKLLSVWPFFIFFILAFIFFSPFFIQGKAFLAADNLYSFYPWKFYAPQDFRPHNALITDPVNTFYAEQYNKQLKAGKLQEWNPYILTGVPGIGTISMGYPGRYYPLKLLLHKIFPTYAAHSLLLFIHVFLMGCFMYLYLREIGAGLKGSIFGAVAYMFNGCAMVWLEFESWVVSFSMLPLLLFIMERYLSERRLFYAFAGALVLGLNTLGGNFQIDIYFAIIMFLYFSFIIIRIYKDKAGKQKIPFILLCFTITSFLGLLIASIEILPYWELVARSSRIARTFDFQGLFDTFARVPFRYFITLFFPYYFGSPLSDFILLPSLPSQEYMNFNEINIYMGIITVFAFTACIIAYKDHFSRFYLLTTLLFAAMMTGTFVYYPFFKLVPGMDKMNPTRIIFLFAFSCSAAAGLGVKGLENLSMKRRHLFLGLSSLILSGICFLAVFGNNRKMTIWFNHEQFQPFKAWMSPAIDMLSQLRSLSSPGIYGPLIMSFVAFLLFLLFIYFQKHKLFSVVFALMIMLLSYDLMSFGQRYNTTVKPEDIYPRTPSIDFLLNQERPFRVVQDAGNGLWVNTLVPFNLEEIGGYTSVYPDNINKLMTYTQFRDKVFEGMVMGRWVMFADFSSRLFDLMNVRYVLTSPKVTFTNPKYKLVFLEDMAIYENKQVMPRAFVVHQYAVRKNKAELLKYMGSENFDMRRELVLDKESPHELSAAIKAPLYPPHVTIDKYTPDEVQITADLSEKGWLVLSDTYYPGWKAMVDGRETIILRANYNFRAVALHAGKHNITFTYEPASITWGLRLTVSGLMLAFAGLFIFRKKSLNT